MKRILNYIDGSLVEPASGRYLDSFEPATGMVYSHVADSGAEDVNAAVDAARRAFPSWSTLPAAERSRFMLRIADLIESNLDELARLESIDNGKPVALAKGVDIPRAAANFRFFATAILHAESQATDQDGIALNYTLRRPRGVAGAISPWNLPLYLFTWKIAPALATGNTVVGKPSEVTPMTAFRLAELCIEAGLPPGVLNIVHGLGSTAGAALVAHPDVPTITFTGGTSTGRAIAATTAPMFKRVSLELGGKNPNLIFADANLDEAIETSVRSSFSNQGQICLCGSRILVERPVFSEFTERLVEKAKALRPGDPLESETTLGAISSAAHLDKISGYVDLARELGATIHCGGRRATAPNARCANGYFYEPTVITGLQPHCRVEQEEIFGPVVSITPFEDEAEAVELANCTQYGLACSIWTGNLSRAHRVAAQIECGIIWINCWMLRDLRTPFGGMKQSGLGREGGSEALRFFTEPKNICIRY